MLTQSRNYDQRGLSLKCVEERKLLRPDNVCKLCENSYLRGSLEDGVRIWERGVPRTETIIGQGAVPCGKSGRDV